MSNSKWNSEEFDPSLDPILDIFRFLTNTIV